MFALRHNWHRRFLKPSPACRTLLLVACGFEGLSNLLSPDVGRFQPLISKSMYSVSVRLSSGYMKPTRYSQQAFSMPELMVVIAIIAILAGIAIPSVGSMVASTRLSTTSYSLVSAIALARAEASRRGVRVTICAGSIDATTKQVVTTGGACNTTAGVTLWNAAYLVFAETKSGGTIGQYEIGDTLLRAESIPSGITLTPSFVDTFITVLPSGSVSVGGTFDVCSKDLTARQITIKKTGTATSKATTTVCP